MATVGMCCPPPRWRSCAPTPGATRACGASSVKHVVEVDGDLTVLHRVGVDSRRKANASGLLDWRDKRVTPAALGVKGASMAPRLQKLLDVNRTPGPVVRPDRVEAARSSWIDTPPLEFYVDFETVSDIDDDFSTIPARGGQALVFMVGCGHIEDGEWRFECLIADQLTESAEAAAIEQWLSHMTAVRDRLDPGARPKVYHWSSAERASLETAYNAAVKRHGDRGKRWATPRWFDFLKNVMRKEPVVVRGAHGFGLKAITSALHDAGLVETRWADRTNRRAGCDGRGLVVPARGGPRTGGPADGHRSDAGDPRLQRGGLQGDDGDSALPAGEPLMQGSRCVLQREAVDD